MNLTSAYAWALRVAVFRCESRFYLLHFVVFSTPVFGFVCVFQAQISMRIRWCLRTVSLLLKCFIACGYSHGAVFFFNFLKISNSMESNLLWNPQVNLPCLQHTATECFFEPDGSVLTHPSPRLRILPYCNSVTTQRSPMWCFIGLG